jgi:rfaE bifunctional protein nucleotidyltransferase chain/domain
VKKIWVNGKFDILHVGHVRLLQHAKSLGDWLVVGINSDSSIFNRVRKYPIHAEEHRKEMLLALSCVDEVVIFPEPDPCVAITAQGDVSLIIKGMDYQGVSIPEDRLGIEIRYFDSNTTISSTKIKEWISRG